MLALAVSEVARVEFELTDAEALEGRVGDADEDAEKDGEVVAVAVGEWDEP